MKVQTTVLLLCFLSGVFLSSVVHAKPSPALMKELLALEKYLEKKQGSDGADSENKQQNEKPTGQNDNKLLNPFLNANEDKGQSESGDNGQDKTGNENSDNAGGQASNAGQDELNGAVPPEKPEEDFPPTKPEEGVPPTKPEEGVPPAKPEEGVPPAKPKEGVPPAKPEEGVPPAKPEEGAPHEAEGGNPQKGNEQSQSEGQVEKERDSIFADLGDAIRKFKDALDILVTLDDKFRTQFQNDDSKFNELKANNKQTKEKTIENLGKLKTVVEVIDSDLNAPSSVKKKSVQENAPARRSHLSDTEFLNIVHSLLTNN